MEMEDAREGIEKAVGIENDRLVRSEDYDKAVRVNEGLRKAWVESLGKEERHGLGGVDSVEIWPFQLPGTNRVALNVGVGYPM